MAHQLNQIYKSTKKYLKNGPWYYEGNMYTGKHTHMHFNSLQSFWPGIQIAYGDVDEALETLEAFYSIWEKFGVMPERYILNAESVHPSENHYPLRPELIESTYFAFQATQNPMFLDVIITS